MLRDAVVVLTRAAGRQVEKCKLRDYEGDYDLFLEKNEGEADAMAEKEAKKKEVEKSQIKAKSKARGACPRPPVMAGGACGLGD